MKHTKKKLRPPKAGHNTIYDEYGKNVCGHKYEYGMRATVISVESKILPEKRGGEIGQNFAL